MSAATLPGFDSPAERTVILAATSWPTNAELVEALRDLGYLGGRTLDPTFGAGTWWKRWTPDGLIATDLATGVDVCALPFPDAVFDSAVFDPPHLPSYNAETSTRGDWRRRFGITATAPRSSRGIDALYVDGIAELSRVVRPGGNLIVKSTDYVNGRIYQPMAANVAAWLQAATFDVVDVLIMTRSEGPLRRDYAEQLTSWRNYSVATVARRRTRPRRGSS